MRGEVAIIGNNLAALVAAQSLSARSRKVVLVNPAPAWGGHFAGFNFGGRRFDAGMVLYEYSAFNAGSSNDVLSYDPEVRNDCGRFVRQVSDYISPRVRTVPVPGPLMVFRERFHPDLLIANAIEAITMLDPPIPEAISAELTQICAKRDKPLHASRKATDPVFGVLDLEAASIANHGRTLHEALFDPLCQKIFGVGTDRILAVYHRAAWLPLYYPETLLSQFGPSPQKLAKTRFEYPLEGSAGALASRLIAELEANPLVRIVRDAIAGIRTSGSPVIDFANGDTLEPSQLAWTLDPGTLIALNKKDAVPSTYTRASIGLFFFAVPASCVKTEFSTLFVLDPKRKIYRISNHETCANSGADEHRLVAEFKTSELDDHLIADPAALQRELLEELADLRVIHSAGRVAFCSAKILPRALMIPDAKNRDKYLEERSWLEDNVPEIHLAGLSAGFQAGSMNDQIVQGLKLDALMGLQ